MAERRFRQAMASGGRRRLLSALVQGLRSRCRSGRAFGAAGQPVLNRKLRPAPRSRPQPTPPSPVLMRAPARAPWHQDRAPNSPCWRHCRRPPHSQHRGNPARCARDRRSHPRPACGAPYPQRLMVQAGACEEQSNTCSIRHENSRHRAGSIPFVTLARNFLAVSQSSDASIKYMKMRLYLALNATVRHARRKRSSYPQVTRRDRATTDDRRLRPGAPRRGMRAARVAHGQSEAAQNALMSRARARAVRARPAAAQWECACATRKRRSRLRRWRSRRRPGTARSPMSRNDCRP